MSRKEFWIIVTAGIVGCVAMFAPCFISAQSQSPQLSYLHRVDAHTILITVDGVEQLAIDIDRAKEIKATEAKLAEAQVEVAKLTVSLSQAKANTQDERVRVGLCEQRETRAQDLEQQCFALLKKNGSGVRSWLDKWPVVLARDVVPSALDMAKKCK